MTPRATPIDDPEQVERPGMGFREFVALVAAMMSLTALGIDSMLPALPAIGASLDVTEPNRRQFVITAFMVGFAATQLILGPMSDRFGRRPVLGWGLLAYTAANLLAAISGSFTLLLLARAFGGASVAAARTVTVAVIRDRYHGPAMARVTSLAFMVFLVTPILAPAFGQAVLLVGSWRWIFGGIAIVSASVLGWFWWRMPETLAPENHRPLDLRRLREGWGMVLKDRMAVGYTLAAAAMSGGLFGFIGSVQQIVFDVFGRPNMLVVVFTCIAGAMAAGSLVNSRLVERLGTRPISHTALIGFVAVSALHLGIALTGRETIVTFCVLQAAMMGCFSLAGANFSAMAMEHMGHIAGTASSLQGFVQTLGGAVIGAAIGQSFNGSTVPLYAGCLISGGFALAIVLWTERGRLWGRG